MSVRWAKLAGNFHLHPKAVAAGFDGRDTFIWALCKNAEMSFGGRVPAIYFDPTYMVAMLASRDASAASRGVRDACDAGLLARDGAFYVICGWNDPEWGNPKSDAERAREYRERKKSVTSVTAPKVTSVTRHENHVLEERRLDKKREERDVVSPAEPAVRAEGSGPHINPLRPKKPKPSEPTRDELSVVERVLERLCSRTGREYRPTTKIHAQRILRLLREGYGEHDLRLVVWHKANEWSDNERMAPYLRPSTLFGPEKFPEYLAEAKAADAAAARAEKPALPASPIHAGMTRLLGGGS